MTELEFQALAAQGYNRIPLVAEALADLYTPLALYLQARERPVFLPARIGGRRRALRPLLVHRACLRASASRRAAGRVWRLLRDARGADVCVERVDDADPLEYVRGWLRRHKAAPVPAALRFGGGLVGYFGYDTVRHIEPRALGSATGAPKPDPLATPDMLLLVSDELAVVDNVLGKLYLVVYADPREPDALRAARERLDKLRARLAAPLPRDLVLSRATPRSASPTPVERTFAEAASSKPCSAPRTTSLAGDVHAGADLAAHVARFDASPLELYRALRGVNPSPYMFYFDFGDHHVVGASPEILVRLAGDTVTLRPIAGTRPRGATPEEDAAHRRRAAGRPEGARRARDADRPRAQRRRPRRRDRAA